MTINPIQASIYAGYGTAAIALDATSFSVFRGPAETSNPLTGAVVGSIPAVFTSAKLSGFSFERGTLYDDIVFHGMFDGTNCQVGDYLTDGDRIFFIIEMSPFLPIVCVQANRTLTLTNSESQIAVNGGMGNAGPSQFGGTDPYWGRTGQPGANTAGLIIPGCVIASAGRATSRTEQPSAAPGPSRWRIYVSPSSCPKGSIPDRTIVTDEDGNRHMVEAAGWTAQGYRLETIRETM